MTDYSNFFSRDTSNFMRSPVREIFKKVDLESIYSFAGGYPSADTFPLEEIGEAVNGVLARYGGKALQYGATQGVPELRKALSQRYGVPVERIQITSSSQQGIDVCTRVLVDPGDVILTSAPSYLGAIQSFRSYRAEIVGVHAADDIRAGYTAVLDRLAAEGRKVKFLYMIPDFQNPSGETLDGKDRKALIELSEKYGFLIVEDSPYRELRYEGEDVPTMYSMAPDRVIHLGSFSKVFAPGVRLGFMFAHPAILDMIYVCKQSLDLCPPVLGQYVVTEFLTSGRLDANLRKTRELYRHKRDLMLGLLREYMPEGVQWTHPEGGLFLFLRLPGCVDTVRLYDKALSVGVAYVAGSFFHPDGGGRNTMRLNFSFMSEEKIEKGIPLLSRLISEEIRNHSADPCCGTCKADVGECITAGGEIH